MKISTSPKKTATQATQAQSTFLTFIHDVTPEFEDELADLYLALSPLVGNRISSAAIPERPGKAWSQRLLGIVRDCSGEMFLHGLTHTRESGFGPATWLTRRSDEFAGLPRDETAQRIRSGVKTLEETFQRAPIGFLPPCWLSGHATPDHVFELGLEYHVGMRTLSHRGGHRRTLTTWSWDWGRLAFLGHFSGAAARLASLGGQSIPCVVFHPMDVRRGLQARGLNLIQEFLQAGRTPALCQELFG